MAQVSVNINSKIFRIACEEGQESHLEGLAAKLDIYIDRLKEQVGEIGDLRLSIMAGIMILDELDDTRSKLKDASEDVDRIRAHKNQIVSDAEKEESQLSDTLSKLTNQIESLTGKLKD